MILRRSREGWEGVPAEEYKDEPGTWKSVSRRVLFESEGSQFQGRYFEIGPGGHTSFEKHRHEHFVTVLSGKGIVMLGDQEHEVGPGDVVHVTTEVPHCFKNPGESPFGILCVVDRVRDRPVLLDPPGRAERPME